MPDLLAKLNGRLDENTAVLARLDAYYQGLQPLAFMAPEAAEALGGRLSRIATNLPRLVVTSLAERLRVTGFRRDASEDPDLWRVWLANDLDEQSAVAHREALILGSSFVSVWAGPAGPRVRVESAHQVTTETDPATRETVAALKRWTADGRAHAVMYEPDRVTKYRSEAAVVEGAGIPLHGWQTVDTVPNPLGTVPVVELRNTDRLLGVGCSEMADVLPLVDGLNKLLADALVTSEFYSRPRRWAVGIELVEDDDGNVLDPFSNVADRAWVSEAPESKFGSFATADLASYEAAVRVLLQQVMAVSALPAHMVGITTSNPTSADAIRAAEAGIVARAQARMRTFGRSWDRVAALVVAVRDGTDPAAVQVATQWADPSTRSIGQEADAIVKLHTAGLIPAGAALERMGYRADEIARIREMRRDEAFDSAAAFINEPFLTEPALNASRES